MRNIITFDNVIKITTSLLIITMPIVAMPRRFTIIGFGANLSYYFAFLLLCLVAIKIFICKDKVEESVKKYFALLFVWVILTSLYGAFSYPYYNEVVVYNSRFYNLCSHFLGNFFSDDISMKLFLFLKSIRDGFIFLIMPWMVAYAVYFNFRKEGIKGCTYLIYSYVFLGFLLFIYAIPEIMLFKFNMPLGREILSVTNHFLYDVNSYLGWYPPIIWHNQQLRSMCIEPASLAEISIMIIVCLWSLFFQNKSKKVLLLYCLFFVLPIMSKSRTAVLVCAFMLCQLMFYLTDKNINTKDVINIIVASFVSVVFAVTSFGFITNSQSNEDNGFVAYYEDNIRTIASTKARSNGSRLTNIKNHMNVIIQKPIMGTGMFYKDLYVRDNMIENALEEAEILNITRGLEKEGIFKYSYGNVNNYIFLACSIGIPGLILYLFPAFFCIYMAIKTKKNKCNVCISLLISLNTAFLVMNLGGAGLSFFLTVSMMFLFINGSYSDKLLFRKG